MKTIELSNEQIDLITHILKEKIDELEAITKYDANDLDPQTIEGMQLEHRDITEVLRELKYFAKEKEEETI